MDSFQDLIDVSQFMYKMRFGTIVPSLHTVFLDLWFCVLTQLKYLSFPNVEMSNLRNTLLTYARIPPALKMSHYLLLEILKTVKYPMKHD